MDTADLNILGKDYLNELEAAHYACVSHSQFRAKAEEYGIFPCWWMGRKVYRKTDIQRAMEDQWQRSAFAQVTTPSTGRTKKAVTEKA